MAETLTPIWVDEEVAVAEPLQLSRWLDDSPWRQVRRCDPAARALADRHYSRQTPGATEFMASGRTFVLLAHDHSAVWGAIENLDPVGNRRWRCSIFRNEGVARSSDLIRSATALTVAYWERRWGLPAVPLTTEVDPAKVRTKRDPGRCFLRAGWRRIGVVRGLVVLEAPTAQRLISDFEPCEDEEISRGGPRG